MPKICLFIFFVFLAWSAHAVKINGRVTDPSGEALPFASVYLKGTTKGTTTNAEGWYAYEMQAGTYTLVCQYVGYQKQELEIRVTGKDITQNFILIPRGKELKAVVVTRGEDPALRIMRKTIRKRSEYVKQANSFTANAYIKGSIRLNDTEGAGALMRMMGGSGKKDSTTQKELDSLKGILMLSESYNQIIYKRPDRLKVNVISSRVSGNQQAYGFSEPILFNLYENNVNLGDQLTPRGIVSPIAETAMLSYRYELLDTYQEDGKTVSIIKVIPRRKFEPLFSGKIHVIENEWRLHSVDLYMDKEHQLELLDSLFVQQVFVPVDQAMMVKDQNFRMTFNLFGLGISGHFVNVFSDYDLKTDTKPLFDIYARTYDSSALKRDTNYWNQLRPVPLDTAEVKDYRKKDSLELIKKSEGETVDTIPFRLKRFVLRGYTQKFGPHHRLHWDGLVGLDQLNWNTAEGLNYQYKVRWTYTPDKDRKWSTYFLGRYGFSNQQFNGKVRSRYTWGKTHKNRLQLSGGRYVFQYNPEEPVNPLLNSFYTLVRGQNFMKFYQAIFGELEVSREWVRGIRWTGRVSYQDRNPLRNTNLFWWHRGREHQFTGNYPVEQLTNYESRHQALLVSMNLFWQPGRKLIKYPDRIVGIPSNLPGFSLGLTKGLPVAGSDVDYTRWWVAMEDEMNLRLWGDFRYKIRLGGFLQKKSIYLADFTHFNGSQIILASPYLNSFQLSSYYANSNQESFYSVVHAEHHFNGLLTNKIPLFRRLKWYLVGGTNAYYVNRDLNYVEISAGLENIGYRLIRILRVDALAGLNNFKNPVYGIRIGFQAGAIQLGSSDD